LDKTGSFTLFSALSSLRDFVLKISSISEASDIFFLQKISSISSAPVDTLFPFLLEVFFTPASLIGVSFLRVVALFLANKVINRLVFKRDRSTIVISYLLFALPFYFSFMQKKKVKTIMKKI
jgi:hypothetical protein